ncbi:MAG TPA: hypothetical protein VKB53_07660 [Gammaproteobacteria bacterium]|nr:hypothetical protein [Gammaproteobacteria bacterium]HKH20746.1 hypothetical protein [Gammaproteobacteria bacterium]
MSEQPEHAEEKRGQPPLAVVINQEDGHAVLTNVRKTARAFIA